MSYRVFFKIKVENVDVFFDTSYCNATISYQAGEIIRKSTGLPLVNNCNNGKCKDVVKALRKGLRKIDKCSLENKLVRDFFVRVINSWEIFCLDYPELSEVATFWVQ